MIGSWWSWMYIAGMVVTAGWMTYKCIEKGKPLDVEDLFWTVVLFSLFVCFWPILAFLFLWSGAMDKLNR